MKNEAKESEAAVLEAMQAVEEAENELKALEAPKFFLERMKKLSDAKNDKKLTDDMRFRLTFRQVNRSIMAKTVFLYFG